MPWKIIEGGQDCPFEVVKEDTGERVACHPTREAADAQVRALYANEPMMRERKPHVEIRSATVDNVDFPERTISLIACPYDQRTMVPYRNELWGEIVMRGAFDGIETNQSATYRVNRDHDMRRPVGKIVNYYPKRQEGLIVDAYISDTVLGNETLRLAADGVLGGSVGMQVRHTDQTLDNRAKLRTIRRAFLHHLALVPDPAYQGAEVIGVRDRGNVDEAQLPVLSTPALDEVMYDPILQWASNRLNNQ